MTAITSNLSWSQVMVGLVFAIIGLLTGGVGVALVNGFFRKTKDKKESESIHVQSSAELINLWINTAGHLRDQLLESEKTTKKLSDQLRKSHQEMDDAIREIRSFAMVVRKCIPLLERMADNSDMVDRVE